MTQAKDYFNIRKSQIEIKTKKGISIDEAIKEMDSIIYRWTNTHFDLVHVNYDERVEYFYFEDKSCLMFTTDEEFIQVGASRK